MRSDQRCDDGNWKIQETGSTRVSAIMLYGNKRQRNFVTSIHNDP